MLRLTLRRAISRVRALSLSPLKTPNFAADEAPRLSRSEARQTIDYAFNLARSQRSEESYKQAIQVLEQGTSDMLEDRDAVGMLMLAMSTLLYERREIEVALEMLKLVCQLENTSLRLKAAAWQGLVTLSLEIGLDASPLVGKDCLHMLKNCVESRRSASDVLTCGIRATSGLANLVNGDLKSGELFLTGLIDDNTEEGKDQLGHIRLCRGELLHCTGNLEFAKGLYEKALHAYEHQDNSSMSYLAAANMAPEEIHLGLTCALGQVLSQLGNFGAEEVLSKALKIAEDHFGSTHPKVGVVLTCIALMFRHKAKLEGSGSLSKQEGLYREAINLLRAPGLDTKVGDVQVARQDIVALARGGYADILSDQQNRKGEGERMRKWAEAAWRNRRVSLAQALELSEPSNATVVDTRIYRVI